MGTSAGEVVVLGVSESIAWEVRAFVQIIIIQGVAALQGS
jgi:hypothetical protein